MSEIVKIQDLVADKSLAFKKDQLKVALNQQPPRSWVKKHPFAKNVNYLPVDKIELMLDVYIQDWKIEVLNVAQLFNSVSVTVRLHFLNPITKEWQFHDGVGAVGIQTDKGAKASDLTSVKQDAVMKALPAAKSYALKDAAELLGDVFGRNLNRKDTFGFKSTYEKIDLNTLSDLLMKVGDKLSEDELENINRIIENEEEISYEKAYKLLKSKS